jgi:two-component system response regulator YesN
MFHLLLVDDEASVVDSLADTLPWQEIGITTVFKAYSGYEALEILKTNSIDIMITDIRMPGISGIELLEQVRRNWKKTKSILLSGYAEFSYAQQAIQHKIVDYLLKPVSDEDVLRKVESVVNLLRSEREENQIYHRAVKAFREHLPKIRGELLGDLLQGMRFSSGRLKEELDMLNIHVKQADPFAFMLVRLEDNFTEMDAFSLSLIEYAVGNMAEEIFDGAFQVWQCKDVHDYLVFLIALTEERASEMEQEGKGAEDASEQFQLMASQLQINIKHYLKGAASVLVSEWGIFPDDIHKRYQGMLLSLRKQLGASSELFITVTEETESLTVYSLQTMYEPPLLVHLLESGDWHAIRVKLDNLFGELSAKGAVSAEYLIEVFFGVYSAFSSFAHKSGRKLEEIIGAALADAAGLTPCRSMTALRKWAYQVFDMLQCYMDNETKSNRETLVKKIQTFVQKHLVEDVSLQAIADAMFMHPVHVSRIYKLETGENLSDYVFRLKMDKAALLLMNSSLKTYKIALQLGYQNPNYFNKVFKKYYSLTPQEFRLKITECK